MPTNLEPKSTTSAIVLTSTGSTANVAASLPFGVYSPSGPIAYRLRIGDAHQAHHCHSGCFASSWRSSTAVISPSRRSRTVRKCPSQDLTALSTAPFIFDSLTGTSIGVVGAVLRSRACSRICLSFGAASLFSQSHLTISKFVNDTLATIHDVLRHCLVRNWQAVYRFRISIVHDEKRVLEIRNCLTIWSCILRAEEAMVQTDGWHSSLAKLPVFFRPLTMRPRGPAASRAMSAP